MKTKLIAASKPRRPTQISFIHLGKLEESLSCGHTPKQALQCAGLSQGDLDNAADDDVMACFAIGLLSGDCAGGEVEVETAGANANVTLEEVAE